MNARAQMLKKACDEALANPKLRQDPKTGQTYCNVAVMLVAEAMGYPEFLGKVANEQYEIMSQSRWWRKLEMDEAQEAALDGQLVIAAQRGKPHGHVCIVYPSEKKVYSGKWAREVPLVANVGPAESTGIIGLNFAFSRMPELFMLRPVYQDGLV